MIFQYSAAVQEISDKILQSSVPQKHFLSIPFIPLSHNPSTLQEDLKFLLLKILLPQNLSLLKSIFSDLQNPLKFLCSQNPTFRKLYYSKSYIPKTLLIQILCSQNFITPNPIFPKLYYSKSYIPKTLLLKILFPLISISHKSHFLLIPFSQNS